MQKLINHAASLYTVVKIHGSLQYGAYLYLDSLHVLSVVQVVEEMQLSMKLWIFADYVFC